MSGLGQAGEACRREHAREIRREAHRLLLFEVGDRCTYGGLALAAKAAPRRNAPACIDQALDSAAPATDIEGKPRVEIPSVGDEGTEADVGAYEYQGI